LTKTERKGNCNYPFRELPRNTHINSHAAGSRLTDIINAVGEGQAK